MLRSRTGEKRALTLTHVSETRLKTLLLEPCTSKHRLRSSPMGVVKRGSPMIVSLSMLAVDWEDKITYELSGLLDNKQVCNDL